MSTIGAVLRRLGLGQLKELNEEPPVRRYQRARPGEHIHIDTKKLGRIDGIGHRITGERRGQPNKRGTGWEVLHVAIDDTSRIAYTQAQGRVSLKSKHDEHDKPAHDLED